MSESTVTREEGILMDMTYDPTVDALWIGLGRADAPVTRAIGPDAFADFDEDGRLVGIEILAASTRFSRDELAALGDGTTWLTLRDAEVAARRQGGPVSAARLRGLLNEGKISGRKIGRDWQVAEHELVNYLESRRPTGRPAGTTAAGQVRSAAKKVAKRLRDRDAKKGKASG